MHLVPSFFALQSNPTLWKITFYLEGLHKGQGHTKVRATLDPGHKGF